MPVNRTMKYLLEYNDKKSEFYYNFINVSGELNHKQSKVGSEPVVVITDELYHSKDFNTMLDSLSERRAPMEQVREVIMLWMLDNEDSW